jgi:hypothetical protein
MSEHTASVTAESIATNAILDVTPWDVVGPLMERAQQYWLATVDPQGHPHVVPLFGIWADGMMHFTAGPATRKARDLAQNPHCVITVTIENYDLMMEGTATKIRDAATLQRLADLYHAKYGWPITVKDGAYDAPYGAPAAGNPPYELYQVRITKAFGFRTAEPYSATRWTFS